MSSSASGAAAAVRPAPPARRLATYADVAGQVARRSSSASGGTVVLSFDSTEVRDRAAAALIGATRDEGVTPESS